VLGVLSRRGFVLGSGAGLAGLLALAACGDDDDGGDAGNQSQTPGNGGDGDGQDGEGSSGQLVLGEAFDRNALLVASIAQRAPYVLFESSGGLVPVADAPDEVTFTFTPQDGGDALEPITTTRRGDDVDRPYYPVVATFPSAGLWDVTADLGDGRTLTSVVAVNETSPLAQIGDPLPVAPTPTVADTLGVTHLCTDDPACPLHEVSLDAATAAGRPVAVLVSTPAFCAVGICGPVLDLLVDATDGRDDVDAIHVEVYTESGDDGPGEPSPLVVDTFALGWEPVLFVADATGTVVARLDNIYDGPELAEALAAAGVGG
jgi:hypothetical protein